VELASAGYPILLLSGSKNGVLGDDTDALLAKQRLAKFGRKLSLEELIRYLLTAEALLRQKKTRLYGSLRTIALSVGFFARALLRQRV
jgi:hypothetical protein